MLLTLYFIQCSCWLCCHTILCLTLKQDQQLSISSQASLSLALTVYAYSPLASPPWTISPATQIHLSSPGTILSATCWTYSCSSSIHKFFHIISHFLMISWLTRWNLSLRYLSGCTLLPGGWRIASFVSLLITAALVHSLVCWWSVVMVRVRVFTIFL